VRTTSMDSIGFVWCLKQWSLVTHHHAGKEDVPMDGPSVVDSDTLHGGCSAPAAGVPAFSSACISTPGLCCPVTPTPCMRPGLPLPCGAAGSGPDFSAGWDGAAINSVPDGAVYPSSSSSAGELLSSVCLQGSGCEPASPAPRLCRLLCPQPAGELRPVVPEGCQ
jgi:hypothetical protein